ncbi:MAG TPA: hypothetical protein VHZ50_17730 [Puia sp.]|nr:hypothetical protein [Puia sp.]
MRTGNKKIFATIVMIMFFILPQLAFPQKCNPEKPCPPGYDCVDGHCKKIEIWTCNCLARGYGCKGNPACLSYCAPHCGVLNDTTSSNVLTDHFFSTNILSFSVSQSEKKPTNSFKKIEVIEIIPGSTMQERIRGIEWGSLDE